MVKKLAAGVLLAAALVSTAAVPATAAQDGGAARTMCALCWPTPAAK